MLAVGRELADVPEKTKMPTFGYGMGSGINTFIHFSDILNNYSRYSK